MRRRSFIAGLGSAVALPLASHAQQPERCGASACSCRATKTTPCGRTDGVRMELRWAGADINRIGAFAQELVGLQPDIIVASSTPVAAALQQETRTIPIVFVSVGDPVASGLVARFDRSAGNITGFANWEASLASLGGKWLELLTQIVGRAAAMFNPDTAPYVETY
jgi:putative tryptophan/tyrosine transport system substrate-binding protein